MKIWIWQKKVKRQNQKLSYLFYLMLNNKVLSRIGYIILSNDIYLIRINFNKIFYYLYLYKGIFEMRDMIYKKFFFLYYYYLAFCIKKTPAITIAKSMLEKNKTKIN